MPKRKERIAPPPTPGGWDFRYANSDAIKGWAQICSTSQANARTAWEKLTSEPRQRSTRQHPLKGSLGERTVNGIAMRQWQYEVTAGGRLWYCIDESEKTIWLTDAHVGHPKQTE